MLCGVKLQFKLTNARPGFYLMKKTADSKPTFKLFAPNCLLDVCKLTPPSNHSNPYSFGTTI